MSQCYGASLTYVISTLKYRSGLALFRILMSYILSMGPYQA